MLKLFREKTTNNEISNKKMKAKMKKRLFERNLNENHSRYLNKQLQPFIVRKP